MKDSNDPSEYIKPLVLKTINTVVTQFKRKPDIFFNEHDFHQYCYHSFYRQKEFSRLYETSDGRRTNMLHPEYPTLKRFRPMSMGRAGKIRKRTSHLTIVVEDSK